MDSEKLAEPWGQRTRQLEQKLGKAQKKVPAWMILEPKGHQQEMPPARLGVPGWQPQCREH